MHMRESLIRGETLLDPEAKRPEGGNNLSLRLNRHVAVAIDHQGDGHERRLPKPRDSRFRAGWVPFAEPSRAPARLAARDNQTQRTNKRRSFAHHASTCFQCTP